MLFFTQDEVVLAFPNDRPAGKRERDTLRANGVPRPRTVVRVRYEGATSTPSVTGIDQLPGVANYLIGNDAARWRKHVSSYAGIVYTDLYPGIDLRYDGTGGQLKSTYTVAPGTDPSAIRWRYTGAADARVDDAGNLVVSLPDPSGQVTATAALTRTLIEHTPVAWQEIAGQRVPVTVRYTLAANQRVGFAVGASDATQPLVLNPTFSTYLGGSGYDEAHDVAVDSAGNAYVTGYTNSTLFPTLNSPPQDTDQAGYDAFVSKYTPSGTLLYSTYFGGNGSDNGDGIAVDRAGSAYITGQTYSTNLFTLNARQTSLSGLTDAFVVKLNSAGDGFVSSTYLGGTQSEAGSAIAVDGAGNAYITGFSTSPDFPDHQNNRASTIDAFVAKLRFTGTTLDYSWYLGGDADDIGNDIAIDGNTNAVITGRTDSTNFPHPNGYQITKAGSSDVFVTKLDLLGALVYSTYLGGSSSDVGESIAVDGTGSAYVTGNTSSTVFPGVGAGALQSACGDSSCNDAFVTKVNASGSALAYSTFLGGDGVDYATGIAVSSAGIAYVTGNTQSSTFPLVSPFQASLKGTRDAFIAVIDPTLPPAQALRYSSYLGGSDQDFGMGIALDPDASIYVAGYTYSNDFPTFNQYQNYASFDASIAKLSDTIGFEDFSAGSAGGDATADKPQSKLWWNDGIWWAVMFSTADNKYQIYKLNWPDKWVRTPAAIDDRPTSRADALWDGTKLYIVSVVSAQPDDPAPTNPNDQARNYRYSYNSATKTYTLDAGFPHPVIYGQTESMTIAKDGVGQLWVAYTQNYQVKYQVSVNDGASWPAANLLPGSTGVFTDDIASVVAFNGKIGGMWTKHNDLDPNGDNFAAVYLCCTCRWNT